MAKLGAAIATRTNPRYARPARPEADDASLPLQAFERALDGDVLCVVYPTVAVLVRLHLIDIGGDVVGGRPLGFVFVALDDVEARHLHSPQASARG